MKSSPNTLPVGHDYVKLGHILRENLPPEMRESGVEIFYIHRQIGQILDDTVTAMESKAPDEGPVILCELYPKDKRGRALDTILRTHFDLMVPDDAKPVVLGPGEPMAFDITHQGLDGEVVTGRVIRQVAEASADEPALITYSLTTVPPESHAAAR